MGHRTNRFRHPCNLLLAVLLQLQLSKDIFQPRNTLFFSLGSGVFTSLWRQKQTTGRCTECAELLTERLQEGCKRLKRNDERLACSQCAELLVDLNVFSLL